MFIRRAIVFGAAILAAVSTGAVAHAGPTGEPALDQTGNYCVMYVPTGAHACVDSADLLPIARAAVLSDDSAVVPNVTVHIATVWDNASYDNGRGSYEFYTSADCTASKTDGNWQNQNLSSIGWSNRISSFQSYGNCQTRLFASINFAGSTYPTSGYVANSSNVGTAMNDNAESIKWT